MALSNIVNMLTCRIQAPCVGNARPVVSGSKQIACMKSLLSRNKQVLQQH